MERINIKRQLSTSQLPPLERDAMSVLEATMLNGKELSYNNINDADGACLPYVNSMVRLRGGQTCQPLRCLHRLLVARFGGKSLRSRCAISYGG